MCLQRNSPSAKVHQHCCLDPMTWDDNEDLKFVGGKCEKPATSCTRSQNSQTIVIYFLRSTSDGRRAHEQPRFHPTASWVVWRQTPKSQLHLLQWYKLSNQSPLGPTERFNLNSLHSLCQDDRRPLTVRLRFLPVAPTLQVYRRHRLVCVLFFFGSLYSLCGVCDFVAAGRFFDIYLDGRG